MTFKILLKVLEARAAGAAGPDAAILGDQRRDAGMDGYVTTHVLDAARGCPAAGMRIDLFRIEGESRRLVRTVETNADGRTDEGGEPHPLRSRAHPAATVPTLIGKRDAASSYNAPLRGVAATGRIRQLSACTIEHD